MSKLIGAKVTAAMPVKVPEQAKGTGSDAPKYIRYTPNDSSAMKSSGAKQRIIR